MLERLVGVLGADSQDETASSRASGVPGTVSAPPTVISPPPARRPWSRWPKARNLHQAQLQEER